MRYGPKNLRFSFTGKNLTHYGGVFLIYLFLKHIELRSLISRHIRFSQRNNSYSLSDMLLALIYPMMLGLGRIDTAHLLKQNGVFQYLTGLPNCPNPTSLRRFLIRFSQRALEKFQRLHNKLLFLMTQQPKPRSSLIFDLDSTVLTVYGRLQGARVGYNPFKKGRPSYHPLVCFEGKSKDLWHGVLRFGDTHSSTGALDLIKICLAKVPATVRSIRIRGDVGFYDHNTIEFLDEQKKGYAIVAKVTKPIQRRLGGLCFRRFAPNLEVASFRYQPYFWKRPHKFIVVRKPIPEEPSEQLTLFQLNSYIYHLVVSNLRLKPENIWRFYTSESCCGVNYQRTKRRLHLDQNTNQVFFSQSGIFSNSVICLQPDKLVQKALSSTRIQQAHFKEPSSQTHSYPQRVSSFWKNLLFETSSEFCIPKDFWICSKTDKQTEIRNLNLSNPTTL